MPIQLRLPTRAVLSALGVLIGGVSVLAAVQGQGQTRDLPGQAQQVLRATGSISGTVVSESGQTVDGARVSLSGSGRGQSSYTNDDGQFAFANLEGGEYRLSVSKTGYVSAVYGQSVPGNGGPGTPIALYEGQRLDDISVTLPRGGVITGAVFDERGRPTVNTNVRILRWTIQNGERTLRQAESARTDDRGIYRAFGLQPGRYVVSAIPSNSAALGAASAEARIELILRNQEANAGGFVVVNREMLRPEVPAVSRGDGSADPVAGYAPVYYPGTTSAGHAMTVRVGVSQEVAGIDFHLSRVMLARVQGNILTPPALNVSGLRVRLHPANDNLPSVSTPSARVGRDGEFTFGAVPPGQYRLVATGSVREPRGDDDDPEDQQERRVYESFGSSRVWGGTDVTVNGQHVTGLAIGLQPGLSISGQIQFDGMSPRPERMDRVRFRLSPAGEAAEASGASNVNGDTEDDGSFTFDGVVPGRYTLTSRGGLGAWNLGSATLGSVDVLDFAIDVPPGSDLNGMQITLVDWETELTGTLQDGMGQPTSDYIVVVFAADQRYWVPFGRRVMGLRPATDGRFRFAGLPPGEYRLAAAANLEPGEWTDPDLLRQLSAASVAVTLGRGEKKTQDLRVAR